MNSLQFNVPAGEALAQCPGYLYSDRVTAMDLPVVSKLSLKFALTRLIHAAGISEPAEVRVVVMDLGNERMYAAVVPMDCRVDLHHYIAERTDVAMPLDGRTLTLNRDQALKVISLAYGN